MLVPLMTIGNFRSIFHSDEKKEALDALRHAKKELEELRSEISLILNQTAPFFSKPESLIHKRVVREVQEATNPTTDTPSSVTTSTTTTQLTTTTSLNSAESTATTTERATSTTIKTS